MQELRLGLNKYREGFSVSRLGDRNGPWCELHCGKLNFYLLNDGVCTHADTPISREECLDLFPEEYRDYVEIWLEVVSRAGLL